MIGASLKAAEVAKKKVVNSRIHVTPSGAKYEADHDFTPAERKRLDAYDLSQNGSVKLGGKLSSAYKPAPMPPSLFEQSIRDLLGAGPKGPSFDYSKVPEHAGGPRNPDFPMQGEEFVQKLLQTGKAPTSVKGVLKGQEERNAQAARGLKLFTDPLVGGIGQAAGGPAGAEIAKNFITPVMGAAVGGDVMADVSVLAHPKATAEQRLRATANIANQTGLPAMALMKVAGKGINAVKSVLKSGDAIGEDFAKALGSAEGSGLSKRPLADVPQYNPKRIPTEPKPVSEPSVTAPKATPKENKRVYHGTLSEFNDFDPSFHNTRTKGPQGSRDAFFFSHTRDSAEAYAYDLQTNRFGRVIEAELDYKNPMRLEKSPTADDIKKAKSLGHDAIETPYEVAVFSKSQIKQVSSSSSVPRDLTPTPKENVKQPTPNTPKPESVTAPKATKEPLYHGGKSGTTMLSASKGGANLDNATSRFGAYSTPDIKEAQRYAEMHGKQGTVYSVENNLSNPYEMSWKEFDSLQDVTKSKPDADGFRKTLPGDQWNARLVELKAEVDARKAELISQGYDGIIIKGSGMRPTEVVHFNDAKVTPNTPKPVEAPQKPTQIPETASVEGQTGVSHAEVDKIRENLGWAPRNPTERKPDAQLIADSKKLAGKESAIAEKVIGDPKATLADDEAIAVGQRLNNLIEKMKGAKKAGDGEAFDLADAEAQRLADALDESGSRQGRDFRARQFLMSQQTDPWIVARKLRKQGVNEKRIAAVTKQLEDANTKVGEQQALIEQLQKAASDSDAREILTNAARTKRKINREAIIKEIDDLWNELPRATAKLSAGIDPEAAKVFGKLVVRHIELGAATVDDAIRTVIEEAAKRGHSVSNLDIYQGVRENAGVPKTVDEAKKLIAKNKAELTRLSQRNVEGAAIPTKEGKRIADITAQVADLESQIKTGAFKKTAKAQKIRSHRLELEEIRLKQLRSEVQGIIKAAEPKSAIGKVNEFARESQLANPIARIVDISANTVKLASHVATNPLRSLISTIVTPKTVGRERFSLTPSRFQNIFDNSPARWKAELKGVLKGADFETIEKYGHPGGWFSRLAGASDVVFKDIYARLAYDDYALGAAKSMKLKGEAFKTYRMDAFKQLVRESGSGPLSPEQVLIARATAQDWAARQTFNIDNVASRSVSALKEGVGTRLDKEFGRNAGDGWRLAMDSVFRFSKVIGNVALEKFNYMGEGIAEAALRGVGTKVRHGMIPVKDARLISDLAAKGLTGLAAIRAGQAAYPWIKSQEWIKGEIVTTAGGTKFVKWTILPGIAGGLDAEQLGGLFGPMLYGATQEMIEESNLTAKQKEQLWTAYAQGQITNQPLSSGVRMLGDIADPKGKTPAQIAANLAARAIIPSGVNEIGQRMDKMRNGVELRKATTPMEEFIKRLPIYRESLSSNEKKISR